MATKKQARAKRAVRRAPRAIRKPKTDLQLMLKALTEAYPADTAAGVQIAWLPDKLLWYASVHKFDKGPREILFGSTGESLTTTLESLAEKLRSRLAKPKQSNLEAFLGE